MSIKRTAISIVAALCSTTIAQAQFAVIDSAQIAQSATHQAAEIAKYVQMIEHQLTQITHLTSQLEQLRHLEHQRPQAARGAAPSGTVNWSGPQRPSLGSSPADEFRASTLHAGERDALVRLRPTEPPPPPPPPPPLTPRRSQNSVGVGHGLGGDDDTMSFMDSIISGISVDLPDGLGWPLECH